MNGGSAGGDDAQVRATSVGASAAERLRHGTGGEVQSVFSRAMNLMGAGGMVCLVSGDVGEGPINAVLALEAGCRLDALGVRPGMRFSVESGRLAIGEGVLSVLLPGSRDGSMRPPSHPLLDAQRAWRNLEALATEVESRGNPQGMGGLLNVLLRRRPRDGVPLPAHAAAALAPLRTLVLSLERRDLRPVPTLAGALIGLGPGLTPAADDLLTGLMIALLHTARAAGHGEAFAASANAAICSVVEGRTTMLSSEFLLHAGRGLGGERVTSLVWRVLHGGPPGVRAAARKVLEVGATSGTDTSLGVLLGTRVGLIIGGPGLP